MTCCIEIDQALGGSFYEDKMGAVIGEAKKKGLARKSKGVLIVEVPEIVRGAAVNFAPNLVCNFLFDLAQKFNLFYNRWPILEPKSEEGKVEVRNFRLFLTAATAQILKNGLLLLGIEPLEKM